MDVLLEVPRGEIDLPGARVALWIYGIAARLTPPALRVALGPPDRATVRLASVPLVPAQPARRARRLRIIQPGEGSASTVRIPAGNGAGPGLALPGEWCLGAAAVLLGEAPVTGRDGPLPSPAARQTLDAFRERLHLLLDEGPGTIAGDEHLGGQAVLDLLRGRKPAPFRKPSPDSAIGRLAIGPAHRVLREVVPEVALLRRNARAALSALSRGIPPPAGMQRRRDRLREKASPSAGPPVLASALGAAIVPRIDDPVDIDLEVLLVADGGARAGTIRARLQVVAPAAREGWPPRSGRGSSRM